MSAQEAISAEASTSPPQRAFGSSFYAAMRILPRLQREAMFEIYAFCRAVDDIADEAGPRDARRSDLQAWRHDIDAVYAGNPPAHLRGLAAAAVGTFALDRDDFAAVIDGMEMDVTADIRAPDWTTLDLYCDRVACAVGRLSVRVFGLEKHAGRALAGHLGRALQLTNILRDLDEDAAIGRLYLPREALDEAGIAARDPQQVLAHPGLARACAQLVTRAQMHFREADAIMDNCSRRSVRAPRIMGRVYEIILANLVARGFAAPRERVHVSRARLLWILLSCAIV